MIDFGLTEEQEALQRSAHEVLSAECPPDLVRATIDTPDGVPRALYARLGELGFFGIRVPERLGGLGLETLDLALVLEELGRVAAPGPFLATQLVIGGLLAGGSARQQKAWLPRLATGEALGTLVVDGTSPEPPAVRAKAARGGWRLDGRAAYVLEPGGADVLLVAAATGRRPEDAALFLVPPDAPGVRIRRREMVDVTRRFGTVELRDVRATTPDLVGRATGGGRLLARLLDLACVGLAADSFGGAVRTLEMAVEYAKVREQFGRPIGSFQAIKHIAAEMVADVEPARSLVWYAAWTQDHRPKERRRLAAMAKAQLGDVYSRTARRSVEIHGGIGFTWEFDLHLWFKRAHVSESLLGDPARHRERVAVLDGY
jgi:alkylation response protein AidB-like acyl-CoA dehydrogenase